MFGLVPVFLQKSFLVISPINKVTGKDSVADVASSLSLNCPRVKVKKTI